MKLNKIVMILIAVFVLNTGNAYAVDKTFKYRTFHNTTKKIINTFDLHMKELSGNKIQFSRTIDSTNSMLDEEMVVDKNYSTVSFATKIPEEKTDYSGEVEGRTVKVKGTLEGELFDRTIELEDDRPFYFTPKINLTDFVLSEADEIQFWMLRKDKLTEYLMQAKKRGDVTIEVDGKDVDAVKVYYSATGPGEKFYKRTYYFRKSDGLFIKKDSTIGEVTVLERDSDS